MLEIDKIWRAALLKPVMKITKILSLFEIL